jgi:hypothetical protein
VHGRHAPQPLQFTHRHLLGLGREARGAQPPLEHCHLALLVTVTAHGTAEATGSTVATIAAVYFSIVFRQPGSRSFLPSWLTTPVPICFRLLWQFSRRADSRVT